MSVADYDTILWDGGGFTGMLRDIAYCYSARSHDLQPILVSMIEQYEHLVLKIGFLKEPWYETHCKMARRYGEE